MKAHKNGNSARMPRWKKKDVVLYQSESSRVLCTIRNGGITMLWRIWYRQRRPEQKVRRWKRVQAQKVQYPLRALPCVFLRRHALQAYAKVLRQSAGKRACVRAPLLLCAAHAAAGKAFMQKAKVMQRHFFFAKSWKKAIKGLTKPKQNNVNASGC